MNFKATAPFFKKPIAVALLVFAIVLTLSVIISTCKSQSTANTDSNKNANYVGSAKCQSCHQKEYTLYKTSDHFHAMDSALPRSVKGDFDNSYFVYFGDTSFFYQRDGKYYVRTKDSTGQKKEFLISFTFGWRPLQQYLVQFDDGRIQALPFCWDTRPKEKGGQRWFHIYGKEKILPGDELFWTDINQNWNYMCADCHTTNYKKSFDAFSNSFHSIWNEDNVSCESCHGPASLHLEWAEKKTSDYPNKGFQISLAAKQIQWTSNNSKGTLLPQQIIYNDTLIETCARCHARALRFTDEYVHGHSFLQSHIPTTIDNNYYIDGQIKNEDYEYGSFLQSKMYSRGVTCINCHDAHSMQLKLQGNALCESCHSPEKFDNPAHHFHPVKTAGAQCANCHMPITDYMQIDERRDHSIRIPRPDLSLTMNTPNACNKCHTDKSVKWAADNFLKWYKDKLPKEKTYGELMFAVSRMTRESESSLNELLSSKNYPAIIKATAIEQYPVFPGALTQLQSYLQSSDPFLRLNALKALAAFPVETIVSSSDALMDDPVTSVRFEAMLRLAAYTQQLSPERKMVFDKVMNEYVNVQQGLTDRPEDFLNQGIVFGQTGRWNDAEAIYLSGVKRFPNFIPFYINLADVYRSQNEEAKAKEFIDKGLRLQPQNADLHYALGLWYVRQNDHVKGIEELKKAFDMNPVNATAAYGYAIALFSTGKAPDAIRVLENFLVKNGNSTTILDGLISICQDQKLDDKANKYSLLRKEVFGY